jgi:hypothetical protein
MAIAWVSLLASGKKPVEQGRMDVFDMQQAGQAGPGSNDHGPYGEL